MNKCIFFIPLTILFFASCDMGTYIRLNSTITKPVANDCIESVLSMQNNLYHRKNDPIGDDIISSYSFWNNEISGGIHQLKDDESRIEIQIGTLWMGNPKPKEKEIEIEKLFAKLFQDLKGKCGSSLDIKFSEIDCAYSSFGSKENRCPSNRN